MSINEAQLLQGKVVLVTGAGGGTCLEVALPALRANFAKLERSQDVFPWDPI
jgi:FlaA1/EpsC-like NDP-sugar epimerase